MFWSSSALGIRPNAPSTRQAVCKLVTTSPQNVVFYPSSLQSLAHSFAHKNLTTPLQSYCSALFSKNTGGGYTPKNLPLVFKHFRTLTTGPLWSLHSPVLVPLERRCFPMENGLYLFARHLAAGLYPSQGEGVHTPIPLHSNGFSAESSLCASVPARPADGPVWLARHSSLATSFCLLTSFLLQSPPQGDFANVSQ